MSITRDEWLRAMEEAGLAAHVNDQDSVTTVEFCALFTPPLDRNAGARRLRRMVDAGLAIKTRKTIRDSTDRAVNITSYKLVKAKKKR